MIDLVNVPSTEFIQFHQAVNSKNLKAEFVGFDKKGNYIYEIRGGTKRPILSDLVT